MPNFDAQKPISVFDIAAAVWRFRLRAFFVSLVVLCFATVAVFLWPKRFDSDAQMFVRLGRGSAAIDPATVGQTIGIQESRETEMNSIVNMLESRGLAERVVDDIGVEALLKKYAFAEITIENLVGMLPSPSFASESDSLPSEETSQPYTEAEGKRRDLAIKELQENLHIDLPKKSTTILVAYRARTPQLAQQVVQSVVDIYRGIHLQAYQSDGSLDFFEQQLSQQKQIVADAEDALRKAKDQFGVVTLQGRQESIKEEFTELKKLQLAAQAELQAAMERVRLLKSRWSTLPLEVNSQRTQGIAENARDAMRNRLYELELQERELSAKYEASHPELRKVTQQLESARTILDAQPEERELTSFAVNPVRVEVENSLIKAESELEAHKAKVQSLVGQEESLRLRQQALNQLELTNVELQRTIDIARENYRTYAKKVEESRINEALDQESLSNVSLVSGPTLRYKHSSPKRSLLLILALAMSASAGIATALLSELRVQYIHQREMEEIHRSQFSASRVSPDYPRPDNQDFSAPLSTSAAPHQDRERLSNSIGGQSAETQTK